MDEAINNSVNVTIRGIVLSLISKCMRCVVLRVRMLSTTRELLGRESLSLKYEHGESGK